MLEDPDAPTSFLAMQDTKHEGERTKPMGWLPPGSEVAVIGAQGGIGRALVSRLSQHPAISTLHAFARRPDEVWAGDKIAPAPMDLTDEASIKAAARKLNAPRLVVVASGILHDATHRPEKSWRELDAEWLERAMRINAFGPALIAKHFLPKLPRDGKSVFAVLSARVGSIGDNQLGGWYGYRASKAALNMLVKTLSIELGRTHPQACALCLHPGTVDTALSGPFQRGVPSDRLFTPDYSAECLLRVIDNADASMSGGFYAWDGQPIPY